MIKTIVVENTYERRAYFGEYNIPQRDIIDLENLGTVKIKNDNETDILFSFTPIDEPEREMDFSAVKAETIPESIELDLLCRTWRTVACTEEEHIGSLLFISSAGTYFFTDPEGRSNSLSRWRWYNDEKEEFDYSHDNWVHYGRVEIIDLSLDSLKIFDPGFNSIIPGYSRAGLNIFWEFVPIGN